MNLETYDKTVAPHLRKIESGGRGLCLEAGKVQSAIALLPARPAYPTLAREWLNETETDLRVALAVVQMAQKRYDELPVIIENFREAAE